jgi:hypothetical protein
MRTRTRRAAGALAALALLLAGAAGRAQAGLIVSNLSQTQNSLGFNSFLAQSFTAGGVSQTLGSVTLRLMNDASLDKTVTVNLFSDNGGVPGSSLLAIGSVTLPAHTNSFADFALSAPSAFPLQANTTYWLEAEGSFSSLGVPGAVEWAETDSTTTTGPGTLGNWADTNNPSFGWVPDTSGRLQMEVDSAPVAGVPEPSGLALLGLGGAGLLGWRVRRRRAVA